MTIQVFPVVPREYQGPPLMVRRRARDGSIVDRPCPQQPVTWFVDWHEAARGRFKHHAQDIFAPEGSDVLAPEDAVVVASSADSGPTEKGGHVLRLAVRNERNETTRTYYLAHLRDVPLVRVGERVTAGQKIAEVGRTGNAVTTCPHLHLGARLYRTGRAINLFGELVAVDPRNGAAPRALPDAKPLDAISGESSTPSATDPQTPASPQTPQPPATPTPAKPKSKKSKSTKGKAAKPAKRRAS